ncbi:MAG TPA: alcohol dehydrogenase catalytic domain-containing protein, partial [Polyangiales bacterium]|nr:alcohol dehydrogenase catalytic domain-containing protein [Polyangiales bacterium]
MKSYELQKSDGFSALARCERERPRLAATEVRVRVRAVSLNFRDLAIAKTAKHSKKAPVVPCSDGAGEVIELGSGVTRWKLG